MIQRSHVHHSTPDQDEVLQAVVTGEGDLESEPYRFSVPEGAEILLVTASAAGSRGFLDAPDGATVQVVSPLGERYYPEPAREGGPLTLARRSPTAGEWQVTVQQRAASIDLELNLAAIHPGFGTRAKKWSRWFGCRGCRFTLRSMLIWLLASLAPWLTAGLEGPELLDHLPPNVRDALSRILDLDDWKLFAFLRFLSELINDPIDRAMEKMCRWLGLCPAG